MFVYARTWIWSCASWFFTGNLMLRSWIFSLAPLREFDARLLVCALKPGLGQCVGCLCILHAQDVGSIDSKENVWEFGMAEAGRRKTKDIGHIAWQVALWTHKCKSSLTRTAVKNGTRNFNNEDVCIWAKKLIMSLMNKANWTKSTAGYSENMRKRNFHEYQVKDKHDMNYQQRYIQWSKPFQLGQTSPVNPTHCYTIDVLQLLLGLFGIYARPLRDKRFLFASFC